MKNAAKVGLFLIIFFGLVFGAYSILGRSLFGKKHRIYYVRLVDAGGLAEGTKVLMAGVHIGEVRQVALLDPHHARLTLSLHEDDRLPVGAEAVIPGSLVGFGENELEIISPPNVQGYLPDGSTIPGSKAGPLDALLTGRTKSIVGNIDKSLDSVRKLLQDQGLQKGLKQLMTTANQTLLASQVSLARFNSLSDQATKLIATNQGNLQSIVLSMKETLEQVHYTASTLAAFVKQGKLQSGTTELLSKASRIEDQSSQLLGSLNKIAGDPNLQKNLQATTQNIAATTEKGPGIAENVQKLTANMADITENSKTLPAKLNDVADRTIKLEDSLNSLVNKFNGVKAPSTEGLKDLHAELDLTRETNPSYYRTDVNLTYPLKEGFITFGVYDAFESNKINLQIAHAFSPTLDVRYGIYASKVGVGVDYSLTRRLSVRTDLFDINSLELDARLRYDFGGGFIGWAGVDRAFDRSESPNFGIGFRE